MLKGHKIQNQTTTHVIMALRINPDPKGKGYGILVRTKYISRTYSTGCIEVLGLKPSPHDLRLISLPSAKHWGGGGRSRQGHVDHPEFFSHTRQMLGWHLEFWLCWLPFLRSVTKYRRGGHFWYHLEHVATFCKTVGNNGNDARFQVPDLKLFFSFKTTV